MMSRDLRAAPDGKMMRSSVYGPVDSWRYGLSLGIDLLLIDSICSFNCLYCQLGTINQRTTVRGLFVPTETVLRDLSLCDWPSANAITFSGSGEPTLAANLGQAIRLVKRATRKPTVVLTNGALLDDASVRAEIANADEVACKLDAISEEDLRRLNRPASGISLDQIVRGLKALRDELRGKLTAQVMLLPMNLAHVGRFAEILLEIRPDEIHLNQPSRPKPREWSLATRGEHRAGVTGNSFRLLSRNEVLEFAKELARRTGIKVVMAARA